MDLGTGASDIPNNLGTLRKVKLEILHPDGSLAHGPITGSWNFDIIIHATKVCPSPVGWIKMWDDGLSYPDATYK